MQTPIRQKGPNFRISYFCPSKCRPCTVPSAWGACPLPAATAIRGLFLSEKLMKFELGLSNLSIQFCPHFPVHRIRCERH